VERNSAGRIRAPTVTRRWLKNGHSAAKLDYYSMTRQDTVSRRRNRVSDGSHSLTTIEKSADSTEVSTHADVRLLGPCIFAVDGVEVDLNRWPKKAATLLRLLAMRAGQKVARDEAIEALWPVAPPEAGLNSLKNLLHRVRRVLGERSDLSPISLSHGWVMLNPAWTWTVDAMQLLEASTSAGGDVLALERAVALFRGEPLLEDRYEQWTIVQRDRLCRAWRELSMRLASLYGAHGALLESTQTLQRLIAFDPLDEDALRELMAALHGLGHDLDALRSYDAFVEALHRDMSLSPSTATEQLAQDIRSHLERGTTVLPAVPRPTIPLGRFVGARPDTVLVSRRSEVERVALAVQSIEEGTGSCVLICGEAGVGKTRLAQEAAVVAWDCQYLVAAATATDSARHLPFGLMYDIASVAFHLADTSTRLAASRQWPNFMSLLHEGPGSDRVGFPDEINEGLLIRTVTGVISLIARHTPLVILLDDIHRADEGSLRFLDHLVRRTRGTRTAIVATCPYDTLAPDHPVRDLVRQLGRTGLVERIDVQRLSRDDTGRLIASVMGEQLPTEAFLEFVHARTKGNPFFVYRVLESLGGHYRLRQQIGAGGMGQVFGADDMETGQQVAVKIMFARTEADATAMIRFQREALVLSRLAHPNIVKIHDSFVDEYSGFLITELVYGESLQDVMRGGALTLARIQGILLQVLDALECAHGRGIVHHDIKPANILLDSHDRVTITDFGIASLIRPANEPSLTTTGMRMGTPLYMAPEQIQGKAVDARSDLYSLGAVLYELVTGRPPFRGPDALSVAMQHHSEAPRAPSIFRGDLPTEWDHLILKLLAKDADQRPHTAVEVRHMVEALPCPEATEMEEPRRNVARIPKMTGTGLPIPHTTSPRRSLLNWRQALAGVATILVLLLSVAFVLVQGVTSHARFPSGSPQEAVASYFRLLQGGQVDSAFQLTASAQLPNAETARKRFHAVFGAWRRKARGVSVLDAQTFRNGAKVTVDVTIFDGNALGESDTTTRRTVNVVYSHGRWRIQDPAPGLP
jgi:serine/threonine protein kinase/DNA-binding SARP family transcriptional activator